MAIKKVRFYFGTETINSSPTLGDLTFYTKIDGSWQKYDIGSKINNLETNNILIEPSSNYKTSFDFTTLFTATSKYLFVNTSKTAESYIDIIFKTPLDVINQIEYSTMDGGVWYTRTLQIEIYDEDNVVIYSNNSVPLSKQNDQKVTLLTPDLEYIKTYTTNKISYIETTDTNQLKQVFGVNSIEIINKELEDNTYCRFLFSFDGRQTYKTFDMDSNTWVECAKEDIIDKGLSKDDIEGTVYKYISDGLEDTATIDILVGMMTMNPIKTPSIQKITIDYLKIKDETE